MKRALFFALIVVLAFKWGEAALGIDAIGALTNAQLTCLKKDGNSFFIARVYRSNGKVDTDGIQNIKTARAAGFTDVDGYIFPCLSSTCPSASAQITAAYNALQSAGATIGRLWLDIEILAWPSSQSSNQQFVLDMAKTATGLGLQVGIYSNPNNWQSIVGSSFTGVSQYPLWWARYNNAQDLSTGWSNFGGWSAPTIHQYAGDTTECGIGVDKNFK